MKRGKSKGRNVRALPVLCSTMNRSFAKPTCAEGILSVHAVHRLIASKIQVFVYIIYVCLLCIFIMYIIRTDTVYILKIFTCIFMYIFIFLYFILYSI